MSSISFVIPIFNEEEILKNQLLPFLKELRASPWEYEVIAVDDGSSDHSFTILEELKMEHPELRLFKHARNQGIGGSYLTGLQNANHEFVMFLAIDLPLTESYLQPFFENLGKADVLVGTRTQREGYTGLMLFNSKVYHLLTRFLFQLKLKDVNWISCYRKTLFEGVSMRYRGIVMMLELLLHAREKGASFLEIPVVQPKRPGNKTPSAAQFGVMKKTFFQFLALWLQRGRR